MNTIPITVVQMEASTMTPMAHAVSSLAIGIIAGIIAGLITNVLAAKMNPSSRDRPISFVVIEHSVTPHYVAAPQAQTYPQAPASADPNDTLIIRLGLAILVMVGVDWWYAKHEQLVITVSLVAIGLVIGLFIPTLWTLYVRPGLWRKAAWMLTASVATLYLFWNFLFHRMPTAYYAQLQSLHAAPNLIWTHVQGDILIGYRLAGWGLAMLNIGMLLLAVIGLLVIAYRRDGRPVPRFLWDITEFRGGGLTVLLITGISYLLVSGVLYSVWRLVVQH